MKQPVLCIGEVLWDALPGGLFLGGAPFNVACHLHELGERVLFASRVGDDLLGAEIVRRMEHRGMDTRLVQVDDSLATGFVRVGLDASGSPDFTILEPSAWDKVAATEDLLDAERSARSVVYGSLAQRGDTTRATISAVAALAGERVFDVNLRPPFDDRGVVERSLADATFAKLNDDELRTLASWFGLPDGEEPSVRALAGRFGIDTVCVTRGASGAAYLDDGVWYEHSGFRVSVADTVGSGDAFLAGLLAQRHAGADAADALDYANALGAYVAGQQGATPRHDADAIASLRAARA